MSSYGKCNKIHDMGKVWEIDTHTFPMVLVVFPHTIPILWYTSSHEKCMFFLINFIHITEKYSQTYRMGKVFKIGSR